MLADSVTIPTEIFVAGMMVVCTGLIGAITYLFKRSVELGAIVERLQERSTDQERRVGALESIRLTSYERRQTENGA